MRYAITYKGKTDQLLTLDNTVTNDINRAATFSNIEDAEGWLMDIRYFYHGGRLLDNLEIIKMEG